jgi:hypothetical protein
MDIFRSAMEGFFQSHFERKGGLKANQTDDQTASDIGSSLFGRKPLPQFLL